MLPQNKPDRIRILFDDHRLVANAGLLVPATLARHLGLRELVDHHLDLGGAPGRANTGDKMLTLVASALAGGDCIDDADALRAGGTVGVLGCVVKAPSTLGTFLRSFRWGHVRQLDRVSRQLLARAWAAGAGPGDAPFTIDLDSTICETYGLAKEGARHHGYTGARGYHPLLAVAVCRRMDVRFSIAIRQRARLHNLIEAIPQDAWTPIPSEPLLALRSANQLPLSIDLATFYHVAEPTRLRYYDVWSRQYACDMLVWGML